MAKRDEYVAKMYPFPVEHKEGWLTITYPNGLTVEALPDVYEVITSSEYRQLCKICREAGYTDVKGQDGTVTWIKPNNEGK